MTDIDDELDEMRSQLTHGYEHEQQTPATGQQLAGDAPGGLTWAEFIQQQRPSPTGDSALERLRSLPEEQQKQEQEKQQDQSRGR